MNIIGIATDVPSCSAAALINNGQILFASTEERLIREKNSIRFPSKAIDFCLSASDLKLENIDAIAVSWNPLINIFESTSQRPISNSRSKFDLLYTCPANFMSIMKERPTFLKQEIDFSGKKINLYVN